MKYKGTPKYQTKMIFEMSGMLMFGQSKHAAKKAARVGGARNPSEYAQTTGIYSFSTYRAYFKTCTELLQYAADVHGVRRADRLTGEIVRDFLLSKTGVKLASFRRYCAGLTKFDAALSRLLDRSPLWTETLKNFRASAPVALDGEQPARTYRQPSALVAQLDGDMRLVAELQWRSGLRVTEACMIRPEQMKGMTTDHDEKKFGLLEIKGKGSKVRTVPVTTEIYEKLQTRLERETMIIAPAQYRVQLRQAAHQSGQQYTYHGTHGLRWNYAQQQMDKLIAGGMAYEVALTMVSRMMGHERAGITSHYLRKG